MFISVAKGSRRPHSKDIFNQFPRFLFLFNPAILGIEATLRERRAMKHFFFIILLLYVYIGYAAGENIDTILVVGHAHPAYLDESVRVTYTMYGDKKGKLRLPQNIAPLKLILGPLYTTIHAGSTDNSPVIRTETSFLFQHPGAGNYTLAPAVWFAEDSLFYKLTNSVSIQVYDSYRPLEVAERDSVYTPSFLADFAKEPKNWKEVRIEGEIPSVVKAGVPFPVVYKFIYAYNGLRLMQVDAPNIPSKYIHKVYELPNQREVAVVSFQGEYRFCITLWKGELCYPEAGTQEWEGPSAVYVPRTMPWLRDTVKCAPCTIQVINNNL